MPLDRLKFTISCCLFVITTGLYPNDTWKITSLNWEPYSGESLVNQGRSINELRIILEKHGIDLIVEFYPWKRAINLAQSQDYIGYFPAWPEEVSNGFVKSLPVDWSNIDLLKLKKTDIKFTNIEQIFIDYKIGIVLGYIYPKEISDLIDKYHDNIHTIQNEESLMILLTKKRFDIAITDAEVMFFQADKNNINGIEIFKHIVKKELVISLRDDDQNRATIELLQQILK